MPLDRRILQIPGHMYKDELRWIHARSCEVPDGGIIVEIGSFRGRSAAAWYQGIEGRGRLVCVDPWDAAYPEGKPSDYEIFKQSMATMGYKPEVIQSSSRLASALFRDQSLDVVFIDGDHNEAGIDVDLWLPKMKPCGMICGHDMRPDSKVEADILARLPDAKRVKGSIWEWRKVS